MTNQRILRVSLATTADDFEPLVLEPGLPLLDSSGSSEEVVRTWLRRFAAKPVMRGDQVDFILCDDKGQTVATESVAVEPITANDLTGETPLRAELTELKERLGKAEPTNESEQRLKEILTENLDFLTGKSPETHRACQLFKYELAGNTYLVWCWGYQRKGPELIAPAVCTNPNCQMLFLKRDGNVCPACKQAADRAAAVGGAGASPLRWLVAGALLLAAVGLGYSLKPGNLAVLQPSADPFVADPANWEGPIGASIPLIANLKGVKDESERNVIGKSVVMVDDPTVLKLDDDGTSVQAKSVGKTVVHYYYGEYETRSTFIVRPATMPESLSIEPANFEIAKGSTSDYRVIGTYADGSTADLTKVSTISVKGDAVYESDGTLQGVREGTAELKAKYRPNPTNTPLEANATVTIENVTFDELSLVIDPQTLSVGHKAMIAATLTSADGQTHSADNATGLQLSVSPSHVAKVKGGQLIAMAAGESVLRATYEGLSAEINFSVNGSAPKAALPFKVRPNQLKLVVGESVSLEVTGDDQGVSEATSLDPAVAKISGDLKVIGVSPGETTITVQRGDESVSVAVEVKSEAIQGLAIEPEHIRVPVGKSVSFRVVGLTEDGDQVELDTEQITAQRVPPASQATVDLQRHTVQGLQPSDGSVGLFVVEFQGMTAYATIEVVVAPASIEISPSDLIELPVGQQQQIDLFTVRGNQRTKLESKQIRWQLHPESVPGLRFDRSTATVTAVAASDESLTIQASLPGGDAEATVQVRVVPAESLQLGLSAERDNYLVGETGGVRVKLNGASGTVTAARPVQFTSSDAKIVRVDPRTGAFKAIAEGTATITATHPDASENATVEMNVVATESARLAINPSEVTVAVGNRIELSAKLLDINAQDSSGGDSIASVDVQWSFDKPDAIRWEPPFLTGRKVAEQFEVRATFKGMEALGTVEVTPSADAEGQRPTIRIQPSKTKLAVDQSVILRVEQQSGKDESWLEVSPGTIEWESSSAVVVNQNGTARAIATLVSSDDKEPQTVSANYRDGRAELKIEILDEAPTIDPSTPLTIRREPAGDSIAAGQSQTYMVVAGAEPETPSIANVNWMPAFENANVVWDPPTLTAKQAGSTERLWAKANGQRIEFETKLVEKAIKTPPSAGMKAAESTEGLRVAPNPMSLLVGESLSVGDGLRVTLDGQDISGHATIKSIDTSIVRYSKDTDSIVGVSPGETELTVYHEKYQRTISVTVSPSGMTDADTEEPSTAKVSPSDGQLLIGQALSLRATAESQKGRSIDRTDSAIFRSSDKGVLKVNGNQVVGVSAGKADVDVFLPGHEPVTATFSVVGGKMTNLVAEPKSLEINLGNSAQLAFSATDADGNAVKLSAGELDFKVGGDNPDVIEVDADGIVKAMELGRASVMATGTDGLSANIEVTVTELQIKELQLDPSKARIAVGEKQSFRVLIIGDNAVRPVDENDGATFSLSDKSIGRLIKDGLVVEGTAPGQLTVKANFGGKSATATVTVNDNPAALLTEDSDQPVSDIQLVLSGPDEITVGATAKYKIHIISYSAEKDVTNESVQLLVEPINEADKVEVRSGGRVTGVKPGQLTVRAQYRGLISNPVPLIVSEAADKFQSIALELSDAPMNVGEIRPYKLWGVPLDGGARQDLTNRITTDLNDKSSPRVAIKQTPEDKNSKESGSDSVVKHQPPMIIATASGEFEIIAAMGDARSQPRKVTVLPADGRESSLRADPSQISVQVGQMLPPVTIYSSSAGSLPKPVDAKLVSDDSSILKAEASELGIFTALKPGKSTITATFNGATVNVPVTVVGNRVEKVSLTDVELTDDGFTLQVNIEGQYPEGELEYRAVTPAGESKTEWKAAVVNNALVTAELPIGRLKRGDKNRIYYLIIESRLKDGGAVQRYPVAFRLLIDAKQATTQ